MSILETLSSSAQKMTYAESSSEQKMTYADAGVNIDAGNELIKRIAPLTKQTSRTGANIDLGGFGGLFDLQACNYQNPVLVASSDGVGTKLKIAMEANLHKTVGIDLVAMSVNDIIVQGAEPLFFLDYFASGKLKLDIATDVIGGIAEGCKQAGCALIGGESAEMPGIYANGDYDLAGFCVGAVERERILPKKNIQSGDTLIGLASSGVHSNGFSLVRKLVEASGLSWHDGAPFEDKKLGESLLTPTRIYVKPLLKVLNQDYEIKALSHITGGGFLENIPRILPKNICAEITLESWDLPPVFKWLQQQGNIATAELLRTFNCGMGMVLVVDPTQANSLCDSLNAEGEQARIIGQLNKAEQGKNQVKLIGSFAQVS